MTLAGKRAVLLGSASGTGHATAKVVVGSIESCATREKSSVCTASGSC